jgi:uncharacterized protein
MVRPRQVLQLCTGFEWDDGNATKNWELHEVEQHECEQVFFNRPLLVRRDSTHSVTEPRYYVLGRTDAGRLLFVAYAVRKNLIRVISARDMTENEEAHYLK